MRPFNVFLRGRIFHGPRLIRHTLNDNRLLCGRGVNGRIRNVDESESLLKVYDSTN